MYQATRQAALKKSKQDGKVDSKIKSKEIMTQDKDLQTPTEGPASEAGANRCSNIETPSGKDAVNLVIPNIPTPPNRENKDDDGTTPVTTPEGIARYFQEATKNFEIMIHRAVESLVDNIKAVEARLGAAIEFESKRVTELEGKNVNLERRMGDLEKEVQALRAETANHQADINKSERFSRRNNIRIVGIPESTTENEDCVALVEGIAREKFGLNLNIERAHRDGKASKGHSRHILFKTLSYRHKVSLMQNQREKLSKEKYYMTDDLTKDDLIEKRKWNVEVQKLYHQNVKLRFSAGKWRNQGGVPYEFKPTGK